MVGPVDSEFHGNMVTFIDLRVMFSRALSGPTVPVTTPDERTTSPLGILLLDTGRAERSRTHPEGSPQIDAWFPGKHTYASFIMTLATRC